MRLGTLLGGKAWRSFDSAAKIQRREADKKRRLELEAKARRKELDAAGFRPLGTPRQKKQAWWGAE